MTGFANVEAGIEHFFEHSEAEATKLLSPLLDAVTAAIKSQGLPVVQQALGLLATQAEGVLAGSVTKQAAADAGIAAVKAAGIDLGEDALHALATAAVASA